MSKQTELTATPNQSKRTFTIRTNGNKYRTGRMTKPEFKDALYNTPNDWREYLKRSGDYSTIK